jgi:hypothetical protein
VRPERNDDVAPLRQALPERNDDVAPLRQALPERNDVVAPLRQELQERNDDVAPLRQELQERNDVVAPLRQELQERNDVVAPLRQEPQERNDVAAPLLALLWSKEEKRRDLASVAHPFLRDAAEPEGVPRPRDEAGDDGVGAHPRVGAYPLDSIDGVSPVVRGARLCCPGVEGDGGRHGPWVHVDPGL